VSIGSRSRPVSMVIIAFFSELSVITSKPEALILWSRTMLYTKVFRYFSSAERGTLTNSFSRIGHPVFSLIYCRKNRVYY
jgi:hypothetical protein